MTHNISRNLQKLFQKFTKKNLSMENFEDQYKLFKKYIYLQNIHFFYQIDVLYELYRELPLYLLY